MMIVNVIAKEKLKDTDRMWLQIAKCLQMYQSHDTKEKK